MCDDAESPGLCNGLLSLYWLRIADKREALGEDPNNLHWDLTSLGRYEVLTIWRLQVNEFVEPETIF